MFLQIYVILYILVSVITICHSYQVCITLIDLFGDGWNSDISLLVEATMTNGTIYKSELDLSCLSQELFGCIDTSDAATYTVISQSCNSIPKHSWEVKWSVSVFSNGVEEYFQGIFASEIKIDCNEDCRLINPSTTFSNNGVNNEPNGYIYDIEPSTLDCSLKPVIMFVSSTDVYRIAPSWVVTDLETETKVFGTSASSIATSTFVPSTSVQIDELDCLSDGKYVFRTLGLRANLNPTIVSDESSPMWRFCGLEGSLHEEVVFEISDGECLVLFHLTRKHVCGHAFDESPSLWDQSQNMIQRYYTLITKSYGNYLPHIF